MVNKNIFLTPLFIIFLLSGCGKQEFPSQYLDDRANFIKSIISLNKSRDLSQPKDNSGKPFTMSKDREEKMYSLLEQGLSLSKNIDDDFLDYLHPELKKYYREKLISGTEIYYKGVKESNSGNMLIGVKKQIEGNKLVIEWIDWWKKHNKEIGKKLRY